MTIAKMLAPLFVALLAMGSPVFAAEENKSVIDLPAPRMGTVSFPHEIHQQRAESCEVCHHKGVEAGACTHCHELNQGPPQGKDLFHKICKDCHKQQGGPLKCAGCHTRNS